MRGRFKGSGGANYGTSLTSGGDKQGIVRVGAPGPVGGGECQGGALADGDTSTVDGHTSACQRARAGGEAGDSGLWCRIWEGAGKSGDWGRTGDRRRSDSTAIENCSEDEERRFISFSFSLPLFFLAIYYLSYVFLTSHLLPPLPAAPPGSRLMHVATLGSRIPSPLLAEARGIHETSCVEVRRTVFAITEEEEARLPCPVHGHWSILFLSPALYFAIPLFHTPSLPRLPAILPPCPTTKRTPDTWIPITPRPHPQTHGRPVPTTGETTPSTRATPLPSSSHLSQSASSSLAS